MARIIDPSHVVLELGLEASITEAEMALVELCITKAEGAIRRHLKYDPVKTERTEYYPNMDYSLEGRVGIWEVNDTQAFVRQLAESATSELQVRHIPIRSISSLKIDYDGRSGTRPGSFGSGTEKISGIDFWANFDAVDDDGNAVCLDGIIRSEGLWPDVPGSVQLVYTAGYSQKELMGQATILDASPIMDATVDEAVRRFIKAKQRFKRKLGGFTGPLSSERLGDYSYSTDTNSLQRLVSGGMDLLPSTIHKLQEFINYGWELAS